MGLDKELEKHLDRTDEVRDKLLETIDKTLSKIDIDAIIDEPTTELEQVS